MFERQSKTHVNSLITPGSSQLEVSAGPGHKHFEAWDRLGAPGALGTKAVIRETWDLLRAK